MFPHEFKLALDKNPIAYLPLGSMEYHGYHVGKWETSLLMALFPQLVNLQLMNNKKDRLRAVEGNDPADSTVEYGKKLLEKMLSKIDKLLQ